MKEEVKYIDHLKEDDSIPNQKFVCLSFVSPEGVKNCTLRGLKVRGVFGTKEEADKRAEDLQKMDPDFDVFVGEVGKWLPWDPDPNSVTDQVYQEKGLNDLVKGYKENLEKTKHLQKLRTEEAKAANKEQVPPNKVKERLLKKLEEKKKKKMEAEMKQLENEEKEPNKKEPDTQSNNKEMNLEDKLERIKELYKNVHSK